MVILLHILDTPSSNLGPGTCQLDSFFSPSLSRHMPQMRPLSFPFTCFPIHFIYKDECLFVCLFVCMYGTYTNSHFWTDLNQTLHTSPHWSGRDRRICMDPKFLTSSTFWVLFFGGHCRIMDTRWLPARPFSAITLYPWFQLVFAWRHRHYVVADGGVIRGSLISVILAGVPLTSREWRRSRRQSHPLQRRIPYSGGCSRHVTDITFNRATGPSATALYPSF